MRRPGRRPDAPPVLTGSHLDSQPSGGRFDGVYGVLAGLEALEALEDAGAITERPVVTVAWTNEEGGRFAPGAMGSTVFTGARALEDCLAVRDAQGVSFAAALAETLTAMPEAEMLAFNFPIAAYVEAHIEQGPRLEAEAIPIGVVTGIQGLAVVRGRGAGRKCPCRRGTAARPARRPTGRDFGDPKPQPGHAR